MLIPGGYAVYRHISVNNFLIINKKRTAIGIMASSQINIIYFNELNIEIDFGLEIACNIFCYVLI